MSVPYAKNMAVEFADKTTKGIKIDDKLQSTDAAMELLQQAIEGKIGFDGEISVTITGGYKPTLTADTLEYLYENHNKGGVFKLKGPNDYYEGILSYNSLQKQGDDYSFSSGMWLYGESYKKVSLSSAPLVLWDLPDVIKPLYFHPVIFVDYPTGMGLGLIILNNSREALDTWDKLKAYMVGVATSMNAMARFPVTGSFMSGGERIPARNINAGTDGSIVVFGLDSTGNDKSTILTNLTFYNVVDGVNRIN